MKLLRYLNTQPNKYYFALLSIICGLSLRYIHNRFSIFVFFIYSPCMWTFQEYIAHRFLMHHFEPVKKQHFKHHENPTNESKIFIPIFMTLLFSLINLYPIHFLFGYKIMMVNFSSFVLCYFSFEYTHWATHCLPNSQLLKGPIMFHTIHHVTDYDKQNVKNFGFTSATWDLLFNTCDLHTKNKKYNYLLYIPIPIIPLIIVQKLNYS